MDAMTVVLIGSANKRMPITKQLDNNTLEEIKVYH